MIAAATTWVRIRPALLTNPSPQREVGDAGQHGQGHGDPVERRPAGVAGDHDADHGRQQDHLTKRPGGSAPSTTPARDRRPGRRRRRRSRRRPRRRRVARPRFQVTRPAVRSCVVAVVVGAGGCRGEGGGAHVALLVEGERLRAAPSLSPRTRDGRYDRPRNSSKKFSRPRERRPVCGAGRRQSVSRGGMRVPTLVPSYGKCPPLVQCGLDRRPRRAPSGVDGCGYRCGVLQRTSRRCAPSNRGNA